MNALMTNNKAMYDYKNRSEVVTKEVKEISFRRFLVGLFDLKSLAEEINAAVDAAYREE